MAETRNALEKALPGLRAAMMSTALATSSATRSSIVSEGATITVSGGGGDAFLTGRRGVPAGARDAAQSRKTSQRWFTLVQSPTIVVVCAWASYAAPWVEWALKL